MKLLHKFLHERMPQQLDNTRVVLPVTPLPVDDSAESKFYRDLAALSAMTNEERAKEDFYNEAHNTGTISPTNEEARTGWMEVNPTTGETTWHAPTVKVNNLPGAWEQMAQRAWESPAFQFALAPMFDIPFIFKGLNTKVLPNGIIRNVELNNKIRLSLPSHTATNPRQIVLEPAGAGKYRPHIRIWDGDRVPGVISNSDKQLLYNTMVDLLPYGTELLFPQSGPGYYATRGTVAGLLRLGRDARFIPGSKGILYYTDKDGTIRTFEGTSFIKSPLQIRRTYNLPKISILPVNSTIITGDAPSEISMSPEELYTFLNNLKGYYFYGHGTGRTHVNPEVIFNNGLRIKNGDIANTTIPITEANLVNWPHLNSEEIIILPGKVESVKYDAPFGHIPTDWFDSSAFHWTDNPKMVGRGLFARQEPHASFIETTKNGIPGVFTKPEAILGSYNTRTHTFRFNPNSQYKFLFNQPLLITPENAVSITPLQWTMAQDAAIARGDWQEAQRLRDLHFKIKSPNNFASDSEGMPLDLFHGTRTGKNLKQTGFQREMTGKGNRGAADGNTYLTNNIENAEYTGVKRHEIEPLIDKVTSVYDMFGSSKIPSIEEINLKLDDIWNNIRETSNAASRIKTGSIVDRVGTRMGFKATPTNKKNALLSSMNQMKSEANELSRRSRIVDHLNTGLDFLSGDKGRSSINTLRFIEEPINQNSPFRQVAADRLINAMYNTQGLTYSPEVLRVHTYIRSPLLRDYEMAPTDVNPFKLGRFDSTLQAYNEKELTKLRELSGSEYDGAITKNMFDVLFGDQYIVKDPKFVKLADAVTYDNNGIRIPLGERDNFSTPDIRWGLLPWLFGGTTSYKYLNKK